VQWSLVSTGHHNLKPKVNIIETREKVPSSTGTRAELKRLRSGSWVDMCDEILKSKYYGLPLEAREVG
jgi:hypothetical protein